MKEVTFLNRVPTYPGRVKLTPVAGQADTYDMERADSPIVEGTALDKTTFESVVHSRLTGRYYVPNIERVVVPGGTGLKTNPIPTSGWTETNALVFKSGAYVATASSRYGVGNEPYKAFDGSLSTGWLSRSSPATLSLDFGSAVVVKKIKLFLFANMNVNNITTVLSGSNDNSSWRPLLTLNEMQTELKEYPLTSTGEYRYYRLELSSDIDGGDVGVLEWQISEYDVSTYINAFVVPEGTPVSWSEGQRMMIQTPASFSTMAVTSNTLNGVIVGTILQPNKRYELRYTGSAFVAKEV